uniref:BolA family member 2 n=1 Tax=Rattus norvegicus TaxID=10116 RepID=A0A8I6B1N2_RAT
VELSADYLRGKLQQDLETEQEEVEDTTLNRCATSFRFLVVSAKFEGKPLLQRHQLVNECFAEELSHIHAFEQKTLTPEQWTRQRRECGTQDCTAIKF